MQSQRRHEFARRRQPTVSDTRHSDHHRRSGHRDGQRGGERRNVDTAAANPEQPLNLYRLVTRRVSDARNQPSSNGRGTAEHAVGIAGNGNRAFLHPDRAEKIRAETALPLDIVGYSPNRNHQPSPDRKVVVSGHLHYVVASPQALEDAPLL